jgi:hypothetical protein
MCEWQLWAGKVLWPAIRSTQTALCLDGVVHRCVGVATRQTCRWQTALPQHYPDNGSVSRRVGENGTGHLFSRATGGLEHI